MKLALSNRTTFVTFDPRDDVSAREQGWLISFLSFEDTKNSFFMANGEARKAEATRRHLYFQRDSTIPAGLTRMVHMKAMEEGFQVDVEDLRKWPAPPLGREVTPWLRDFQHEAVDKVFARTRGIISSPTGSGKTEVFCGIVQRAPTCRFLLLAPEADLMINAAERYHLRTGETAGQLGDGRDDVDHRVVCATFQTVSRRLSTDTKRGEMMRFLEGFQGVVVDECHQCPADSNYGVLTAMPNAFYRVGLSGTALSRTDNRNIYTAAAIGDTIYKIEPRKLMEMGFLARPTIRFVPHTIPPPKNKTYAGAYRECVVKSKRRNDLIVQIALNATKPCLVMVKHEAHGRELLKLLKAKGARVEFMYGANSTGERSDAIKRLSWGDTDIAICTKIWQTGTDIPELESLVMAKSGKSAIETIQTAGRVLRVVRDSAGNITKGTADIWDIWDMDAREVNPETGRMHTITTRKWFSEHAKERRLHYMGQGYPVEMLEESDCIRLGLTGK